MEIIRRPKSIIDYKAGDAIGDLYGENTCFRDLVSKIVKGIVSNGKWFSFCTKAEASQEDVMKVKNNKGITLGSLVLNELNTEDNYKVNIYRYLISDYLCYCEIPTVARQLNSGTGFRNTFSKCLITSNITVIAEWLGISYAEAKMFYSGRFGDNSFDRDDNLISYVKLTVSKDGIRKVSKPRKSLDLSEKGIRVIPLFALLDGVEEMYNVCSKGFHDISYIKDAGIQRTINVCFDYSELCNIYEDKGLLSGAFESQFDGRNVDINQIERGYIKVIEVGTSLKSGPVRALNIARITGIKEAKPDLTFINVDLDNVKSDFLNTLVMRNLNYKEFSDMLEIFQVGNGGIYNENKISSYMELEGWISQQEILLGTPFIKQLALFMMGNPKWFEKKEVEEISENQEEPDTLDLDFDLDFDLGSE